MSDSCYLNITCRKEDLTRLLEVLEEELDEEIDSGETWVEFCISQANYGCMEQRQAAAEAEIPFFGYHGVGGDYGSYAFASAGGEMIECETNWSGEPTVAVNELGCIKDEQLVEARKLLELTKRAKELVGA